MKQRWRGALAVVAVAGVALVAGACGGDDDEATTSAATTTAQTAAGSTTAEAAAPRERDQVLVTGDWLADNLDNPDVRVIEVSTDVGLYERGHIPGAGNLNWHTDLVDPVVRDIVDQERLQGLLRDAGVNNDSTVILYGDNNNWFAAWGAWVLKMYGVEDVRLLDGGRAKWESDGRELSPAPAKVDKGNFTASAANNSLRALLPDVRKVVDGEQDAVLIDIRSADEFSGKVFAPEGFQELAIRAGHIPGAVNVSWGQAVNEKDGTIKDVEQLRKLYADAGVDGSKPIIVYCRIGERASHTWYVLSQLLGYEVSVYDGSWTEWGNTVGAPIENPTGTVWGAQ